MTVVELDPEHPVAEGLDHLALHLDLLFLLGDSSSFDSSLPTWERPQPLESGHGGPAVATKRPWRRSSPPGPFTLARLVLDARALGEES